MNQCNGKISKIETFGTVDGPGIRTVLFFNNCLLRCKFCHNPEMWQEKNCNFSSEEIVKKILRNKPYFKNNGGITISGGEPLLQYRFLIDICKKLKKENIHIALDTSGIGLGHYKEILEYIDLVLLDIKHVNKNGFKNITQKDKYDEFIKFISFLNESNKEVWVRQVIIPDVNDNDKYIKELAKFIKKIKNVKKIEFLPFHTIGFTKYKQLNIDNPYINKKAKDEKECKKLYNKFLKIYKKGMK